MTRKLRSGHGDIFLSSALEKGKVGAARQVRASRKLKYS